MILKKTIYKETWKIECCLFLVTKWLVCFYDNLVLLNSFCRILFPFYCFQFDLGIWTCYLYAEVFLVYFGLFALKILYIHSFVIIIGRGWRQAVNDVEELKKKRLPAQDLLSFNGASSIECNNKRFHVQQSYSKTFGRVSNRIY